MKTNFAHQGAHSLKTLDFDKFLSQAAWGILKSGNTAKMLQLML